MAMRNQQVVRHTFNIRKGDQVKVISGRDRGKTGRVLSVHVRKNAVVVEHANLIKRHTRPNPAKNIKGGIVEREAPLNVSNVMIVCPSCGKGTRVGRTLLPDGSRARACRRCEATLDK